MENQDILKYKTYYNYDFSGIESQEFIDLFYKFLVNDKQKPITIIPNKVFDAKNNDNDTNDTSKKFFSFQKETNELKINMDVFSDSGSSLINMEVDNDDLITNQEINFLETIILPSIQEKNISFNALVEIFQSNGLFFENLIKKLQKIEINSVYTGQNYYADFKEALKLEDHMFPIHNKPDGNCLYNSLSLILFGNEEFYFIVKLCTIFVLIKNSSFFKELMRLFCYEYKFETFVQKTSRPREFGTELILLTFSIMLKRTILSFNESIQEGVNNQIEYAVEKNNRKPILIGLAKLHFFPIYYSEKLSFNTNLIKINKSIFLYNQEKLIIKHKL